MECVKTVKELRDLLQKYPGDTPLAVGIDRIYASAGQPPFLMGVEPLLEDTYTEEERAEDPETLQIAEQNGDVYVETPHVFPRVVLWTALPNEDDGRHGKMVGDVFISDQRKKKQEPEAESMPAPRRSSRGVCVLSESRDTLMVVIVA
jgi:hypothetical protein